MDGDSVDNGPEIHPKPSTSSHGVTAMSSMGGIIDTTSESASKTTTTMSAESGTARESGRSASPPLPPPINMMEAVQKAVEACQKGDEAMLEEAFKAGVKGNAVDSEDCSLLHWAAINNHCGIVDRLLSLGADVNVLGGVLASSPIHWAARVGNIQAVAHLVRAKARVDVRDSQGYTPLHLAIQGHYVHCTAYLISHYPELIDITDNSGMTGVMWCAYRTFEMFPLRLLVRAGANIQATERLQGNTALHFAAQERNASAVKELLAGGANALATNAQNETPLDVARNSRHVKIISMMEAAVESTNDRSIISRALHSEKLLRAFQFLSPSLFSLVLAALFHTVPGAVALIIAVILAVFLRYSIDVHNIQHSLIPIGITVAESLTLIGTWCVASSLLWAPWWLHAAFFVTMAALYFALLRCALGDAGTIPRSTTPYDDFKLIVDENRLGHFCYTCFVNKPAGARHCSVCDRCVLSFDHHCPWLNACVTRRNQREFLLFVFCVGFSSAIFVGAVVAFAVHEMKQITFVDWCLTYPWLVIAVLLSLAHVILMSSLFCMQASQIAEGTTTVQRIKGHGHSHGRRGGAATHAQGHTRMREEEEGGESSTEDPEQSSSTVVRYARNCLNFCAGSE